jgi:hypothetical protein
VVFSFERFLTIRAGAGEGPNILVDALDVTVEFILLFELLAAFFAFKFVSWVLNLRLLGENWFLFSEEVERREISRLGE